MLWREIGLHLHAAIDQWPNALTDIASGFCTAKNFVAKDKRVINLMCIGACINRVHDIGLDYNNISCGRYHFFFPAGKFSMALPHKIDFKFIVPVHGRTGELIWNHALIVAEWLSLGCVNAIFSGIFWIHLIFLRKNRIVSEYHRISIDFNAVLSYYII